MALGLLALAMYISCIFHVVCASFSALATRILADAKAYSSGIWALKSQENSPFDRDMWQGLHCPMPPARPAPQPAPKTLMSLFLFFGAGYEARQSPEVSIG